MLPDLIPEEERTLQFGVSRFALTPVLLAITLLLVAAIVQANVSMGLPPGVGSAL